MDISKYLSSKKVRRQIQFWAIIIGFFLIPLLYAVIANDFVAKIQAALSAGLEVTGFAIIGIIVGGLVVYDFKIRSVDDVRDNNDDIDKSFNTLYEKKIAIKQHEVPLCMEYINLENEKGQLAANETLTQRLITKKKQELVKALVSENTKKSNKLSLEIEKLEKQDVHDKKFKGLKYPDAINVKNGLLNKELSYRQRYIDNPTETNWKVKAFTTPLKFLTLGGSLLSGLELGFSWQSLFLFYISITITTAISSLITYILVTNRVINRTYRANLNMIEFIDNMMIWVRNQSNVELIE